MAIGDHFDGSLVSTRLVPTFLIGTAANFYVPILIGSGSGGAGLLETVRTLLWTKIEQNTTRTLKIKVLTHLHHLSLHWHLSRKTGEVLRIVDRGTESVNSLLNYIVFNMVPAFADVIIAVIYLTMTFNIWSVGF